MRSVREEPFVQGEKRLEANHKGGDMLEQIFDRYRDYSFFVLRLFVGIIFFTYGTLKFLGGGLKVSRDIWSSTMFLCRDLWLPS